METERKDFEAALWAYYVGLKAKGWSAPGEGDPTPEALFWREESGKYGVVALEAAWNGWVMRAAVPAPVAQLSEPPEADMFWNDADPDRSADSIHEVLEREWSDGVLEIGETRTIQQAIRLPNVRVIVTAAEDNEDGFDWEYFEAAAPTTPNNTTAFPGTSKKNTP